MTWLWIGTLAALEGNPLTTLNSVSANSGLYSNTVPHEVYPSVAYTEVCLVPGGPTYDLHEAGESPEGGNCEPGDHGYVIEQDERTAATWDEARLQCALSGLRLPEPFEWQVACRRAVDFGMQDMTNNSEWASNHAMAGPNASGSAVGLRGPVLGNGSCDWGSWGWIGRSPVSPSVIAYRCVR